MLSFMFCMMLAAFGIVAVSWLWDIIEDRRKDSWRHKVTAEDLEELGRLLKE